MTGLGEWDDATPVYDAVAAPVADSDEETEEELAEETTAGVAGHVSTALASLDVATLAGGLVAKTVTQEIQRQVRKEVAPIVTAAVAAVLTPERLGELREAASAAAEAELNPPVPERPPEPKPPADEEEPAPPLYYGTVDEFVREFVTPVFRRNVGEEGRADYRWSARWWESAEAVTRLEAIWRAWEHLRRDPATGMSVWLRDHADHHLGVLMSPTGPFCRSKDAAEPSDPLPYEPPPEGLFVDVREPVERAASEKGAAEPPPAS